MKKFSEVDPTLRQSIIDQINQRWRQLYELEKEWGEKAWKYLFLTNSGGAIAMLSFLSAYKESTHIILLKLALVIFVFGVFLIGIGIARHYHYLASLFLSYKEDANNFLIDKTSWEVLTERDAKRTKATCWSTFWNNFWPYFSFTCFIVGSLLGGMALLSPASP